MTWKCKINNHIQKSIGPKDSNDPKTWTAPPFNYLILSTRGVEGDFRPSCRAPREGEGGSWPGGLSSTFSFLRKKSSSSWRSLQRIVCCLNKYLTAEAFQTSRTGQRAGRGEVCGYCTLCVFGLRVRYAR